MARHLRPAIRSPATPAWSAATTRWTLRRPALVAGIERADVWSAATTRWTLRLLQQSGATLACPPSTGRHAR